MLDCYCGGEGCRLCGGSGKVHALDVLGMKVGYGPGELSPEQWRYFINEWGHQLFGELNTSKSRFPLPARRIMGGVADMMAAGYDPFTGLTLVLDAIRATTGRVLQREIKDGVRVATQLEKPSTYSKEGGRMSEDALPF